MKVTYSLTGGLDDRQMQQIHRTALKILEEIGMAVNAQEVPTAQLLERIAAQPGARVAGSRVHFKPELVETYLSQFKAQLKERPPVTESQVIIHPIGHAFYHLPLLADRLVPHTTESLIESTRLIDALYDDGVRGGCPGRPGDVAPGLQELMQYRISCQYCRSVGCPSITSLALAPYFHEMAGVVGLTAADGYFVGFHPISPLRLEGDEFEIALYFWKKFGDKLAVSCGPMPILGVSAPIHLPGAFAQAVAEALGAFTFFKLLTNGGNIDFFFNAYAFDMKHGSFVYGGPEDALIGLVRSQLARWYGMANNAGNKALNTMAALPDAQAAGEKAAKAVIALLAGANSLVGAGGLALDEGFSLEQLMIDVEIAGWAKRVASGFDFSDATLSMEIIRDVIADGGDFLAHESTLSNYRRAYWEPKLFEHLMLSRRNAEGQTALRARAAAEVRSKLSQARSTRSREQFEALESIYRQAEKYVT